MNLMLQRHVTQTEIVFSSKNRILYKVNCLFEIDIFDSGWVLVRVFLFSSPLSTHPPTHLPSRRPAQLHERMSARITCRIGSKKRYLGPNHHFLFSNPPRKCYHSIENRILHPAQLTRKPAQIMERMSAGNTRIRC
jgi:hypothetical protein